MGAVALPWATATTVFGTVTVSGWDGDGKIAAGIAVIGGILLYVGVDWWLPFVAGLLGAALMAWEWWHIDGVAERGVGVVARVGGVWGVPGVGWVCVVGGGGVGWTRPG